MQTLSREQARQLDRQAMDMWGIPGIVLMENAGRSVADEVTHVLCSELNLEPADSIIAVLCPTKELP